MPVCLTPNIVFLQRTDNNISKSHRAIYSLNSNAVFSKEQEYPKLYLHAALFNIQHGIFNN